MLVRSRLIAGAVIAITFAVACKDSAAPKPRVLPRAALNGTFQCSAFAGYYNKGAGAHYYTGTCAQYVSDTRPQRTDSIETITFSIDSAGVVRRRDFPDGHATFDEATGELTISYVARPSDHYLVKVDQLGWFLEQQLAPFDFSGDGIADTLRLAFVKLGA
jgi:hypothetical protein